MPCVGGSLKECLGIANSPRDFQRFSKLKQSGVLRSWPFVVADYLVVRSAVSCCVHARTSRANLFLFREWHAMVDACLRAGRSIVPHTYRSRLQTCGVDLQRLPIVFSEMFKDFERFSRETLFHSGLAPPFCFPEVFCYHFENF